MASIPTVDEKGVVNRVKRLIDRVRVLVNILALNQDCLKSLETVFDNYMYTCKCVGSGVLENSQCTCPLSQKVHKTKWSFWFDQKTKRSLHYI